MSPTNRTQSRVSSPCPLDQRLLAYALGGGALALVAWQTAHWALNSLPPAAASPAMAGLAISIAASAAAIVVAVFIMLFLFRTPPR